MDDKKSQALDGKQNRRLNKTDRLNQETTAAWTEERKRAPHSRVSVPDTNAVLNAKEWVDNGSRL